MTSLEEHRYKKFKVSYLLYRKAELAMDSSKFDMALSLIRKALILEPTNELYLDLELYIKFMIADFKILSMTYT